MFIYVCNVIFQSTADALRKQIKDEIHTKTVMSSRIQSDSSELVKSQAETKQKKERVHLYTLYQLICQEYYSYN